MREPLTTTAMKTLGLAALLIVAAKPSCHGPAAPSEPRGKPDATILENVAFFRAQEAMAGRDSILVALGGISPIAGTTCPDGYWWYRFAQPPTNRLQEWQIGCDGQFTFLGETPDALRLDMTELAPVLTLDSVGAIRVARDSGGQQYLDRYPEARVSLLGRFVGRRPVWQIRFSTTQVPCGFSAVIDGRTSELLLRSDPCP